MTTYDTNTTMQRVIPYNAHLPYGELVEQDAFSQFSLIKSNLGRAVQLRDIKIGFCYWTGQLSKYIRLYGLNFCKEDHVQLILLFFEVLNTPELDFTQVNKFANVLTSLLKKKELLSPKDLQLPWKPLYKLLRDVDFSPYEFFGLVQMPEKIDKVLKKLIRVARPYFPLESTKEMLEEWRPLMCPFDVTMGHAFTFCELFLPTYLPPEHHQHGFKLWFTEFMDIWMANQNFPSWEGSLVKLFGRLSYENTGYIDWEPFMSEIFQRLMRSLNLPVGTGSLRVTRNNGNTTYQTENAVQWIVGMLGGGSTCQSYITTLFNAIETFYHPSNSGKWSARLFELLFRLPTAVVKRLKREKFHEVLWFPEVPTTHRLTDEDKRRFVESMRSVAFLSMFSKGNSNDAALAFYPLALLQPHLIIPQLLDKTYPSIETLTEPHQLISCFNCMVSVARCLVNNPEYPEGRLHVIPLLLCCLPGIDPNDIRKCLVTFRFICTIVSLVTLVDSSAAVNERSDLTEQEQELCRMSVQFEDFVILFMDKVFLLIESCSLAHPSRSGAGNISMNMEENIVDVGLLAAFNLLIQQSSSRIRKIARDKLFTFISSNVFDIHVAGKFISNICRAMAKVDMDAFMEKFFPYFYQVIMDRSKNDDFSTDENLDGEFLWNFKMLSEVCRYGDNEILLQYRDQLISILNVTLHVSCLTTCELAVTLLEHVLHGVTSIRMLDYRNCTQDLEQPLSQYLPIRDWGIVGDLDDLQGQWTIPTENDKLFSIQLLQTFLLPELELLKEHTSNKKTLSREKLKQSLQIINGIISGASSALPTWTDEPVHLVDCLVDLTRFGTISSTKDLDISIDGKNVRLLIFNVIRPLLLHILERAEDDTKSLQKIISIYKLLMFHHGIMRSDFDVKWQSQHIIKSALTNALAGKKRHARGYLIDRIQLQHELLLVNRTPKIFTKTHLHIYEDLLRLSVCRYRDVRRGAQAWLLHGFHQIAYSWMPLFDKILSYLDDDKSIEHHELKGALFVILGTKKRCLVTKRSWEVMNKLWPKLLSTNHSEKPSILTLIDKIISKLIEHKESTEIVLKISEKAITQSEQFWNKPCFPNPALPLPNIEELQRGLVAERERNQLAETLFLKLTNTLAELINAGNCSWKFEEYAYKMLFFLVRYDIHLPPSAVKVFVKNLNNESINIRKVCLQAVSSILRQLKREHVSISIEPSSIESSTASQASSHNNGWLLYNSKCLPTTEEKWNSTQFVDKTHWGFYCWPKEMKCYAPYDKQPRLGRSLEQLNPGEKIIYEHFTDATFVKKFVEYKSLENKEEFSSDRFIFYKGLFRNFDDSFLHLFRPHLERMVADDDISSHEHSHRCAAEIICGLVRGSKHWDFTRIQRLWVWLLPVLKTAISAINVDSIAHWGTCFATASESRDPRRIYPMLQLLLEDLLINTNKASTDMFQLYILQGALSQQEWRIPEILFSLEDQLLPHLSHPYKDVRDRLSSLLVNIYLYDVELPAWKQKSTPQRLNFISKTIAQLKELLANHKLNKSTNKFLAMSEPTSMEIERSSSPVSQSVVKDVRPKPEQMELEIVSGNADSSVQMGESTDDTVDHKELQNQTIQMLKTVLKWIQGVIGRNTQYMSQELLQLLPLISQSENISNDEELIHELNVTMAHIGQAPLTMKTVPHFLDAVKTVLELDSWHARASVLSLLQVCIFSNFFTLQTQEDKEKLKDIVFSCLLDSQLEVREMAAITLGGLLHCKYLMVDDNMLEHFIKLSSTKMRKKRSSGILQSSEYLIYRHAGVLGLCACVRACPYDVPDYAPSVLMSITDHMNDPQPIPKTIQKTLSEFRRTHLDNWQDHKQKFTDDQLGVLTNLLVSPNYYA